MAAQLRAQRKPTQCCESEINGFGPSSNPSTIAQVGLLPVEVGPWVGRKMDGDGDQDRINLLSTQEGGGGEDMGQIRYQGSATSLASQWAFKEAYTDIVTII